VRPASVSGPMSRIAIRIRRCAPEIEGFGEGRIGWIEIRGEPAVEFASMRRAQLSPSQVLPVFCSSNLQVPASRSSGAIPSDRAAADEERRDQLRMSRIRTRWDVRERLSNRVARDVSVRSRPKAFRSPSRLLPSFQTFAYALPKEAQTRNGFKLVLFDGVSEVEGDSRSALREICRTAGNSDYSSSRFVLSTRPVGLPAEASAISFQLCGLTADSVALLLPLYGLTRAREDAARRQLLSFGARLLDPLLLTMVLSTASISDGSPGLIDHVR
jgi:hypothetical protein